MKVVSTQARTLGPEDVTVSVSAGCVTGDWEAVSSCGMTPIETQQAAHDHARDTGHRVILRRESTRTSVTIVEPFEDRRAVQ